MASAGEKKTPVFKSPGGAAYWLVYGSKAIGPVAEIEPNPDMDK